MFKVRTSSGLSVFLIGTFLLVVSLVVFDGSEPLTRDVHAAESIPRSEPDHAEVCRYVGDTFDSRSLLRRMINLGVLDLNNDGNFEVLENGLLTESGERLEIELRDPLAEDALRWFNGTAWLPYKGRFYRVYLDEVGGAFVKAISHIGPDNKEDVICYFDNKVTEAIRATRGDQEFWDICRAVESGEVVEVVLFEKPSPISVEDLNRTTPGSRHYPEATHLFDFDNDGEDERLLQIGVYSSAGRGCDLQYYELLESEGPELRFGAKRDLLMRLQSVNVEDAYPHRRCPGISRWIRYRGQVLFETKYRDKQPLGTHELYRDVTAVRGQEVTRICYGDFVVRPEVK